MIWILIFKPLTSISKILLHQLSVPRIFGRKWFDWYNTHLTFPRFFSSVISRLADISHVSSVIAPSVLYQSSTASSFNYDYPERWPFSISQTLSHSMCRFHSQNFPPTSLFTASSFPSFKSPGGVTIQERYVSTLYIKVGFYSSKSFCVCRIVFFICITYWYPKFTP